MLTVDIDIYIHIVNLHIYNFPNQQILNFQQIGGKTISGKHFPSGLTSQASAWVGAYQAHVMNQAAAALGRLQEEVPSVFQSTGGNSENGSDMPSWWDLTWTRGELNMKHDESTLEHQKHRIYIYIVINNWNFHLDADTDGVFPAQLYGDWTKHGNFILSTMEILAMWKNQNVWILFLGKPLVFHIFLYDYSRVLRSYWDVTSYIWVI